MSSKELVISLRNVAIHYARKRGMFKRDSFVALQDVSFDLHKGDSLGVIGRNGAGKSTLLRAIGGIIKPNGGSVVNCGFRTSLLALQVGFDPQLSGRFNALVSGMLLGLKRTKIEEKLDAIVAFAELEEFIDDPVYTYSSGMKARLGFSVAVHLETDVLLIDEVLAVGDARFKDKSRTEMFNLICSDKTIVLVSHIPETIQQLCNRVVWIEDGKTRMVGDTEEVLGAYNAYMNK